MASIRKRGETFTITAYMGYDEDGKQRKKTTTFRPPEGVIAGKAEKLAKAFAATWEDKIRGYVALDENKTFAELAEWYYSSIAPQTLKPNVLAKNKKGVYDHVIPTLGREKLKNITPPMLDSLFAELYRSGNMEHHFKMKDDVLSLELDRKELKDKVGINRTTVYKVLRGGTVYRKSAEEIATALGLKVDQAFDDVTVQLGLSGATVDKLKQNVSSIFAAAVKKEIMRRNPCFLATGPKIDTRPAAYLNEEQCQVLLDLVSAQDDFQFEVIINLILASGVRVGELTALYWEDVDLEMGVIYIRHTLARIDGVLVRQDPKTERSTRHIYIPEYIVGLLKKHKELQAEQQLAKGEKWKNKDLVFTNRSGGFHDGININKKLKQVIAGTDLPQDLHLHSLRHTHASLLINSDVAVKVISDRLGHKQAKTTLDTYSHVFEESDARAAKAVDMKLFRRAN